MRYFIADTHLFHPTVEQLRYPEINNPDFCSHRHTNAIAHSILKTLKPGDQLWHLGDVSGGKFEASVVSTFRYWREQTGATFHLIAGNHDSVSGIHVNSWKSQALFRTAFDSVQDFATLKFQKRRVLLSHYPFDMLGDGIHRKYPGRYGSVRLRYDGFPLIHGHTHQSNPQISDDEINSIDNGFRRDFLHQMKNDMYCVSWDAHRGLVSEEKIREWLDNRDMEEES